MASTVANILSGNLLDGVSKVINSIRGKSPADAAALEELKQKYQNDFLSAQTDLAKATIVENEQLNATAGANIQAEAKGDFITRDARPMVIWVGLFVIVVNYVVRPFFHAGTLPPVILPDWYWQAWTAICLGYVVARSGDKLFGGAGGTAQFPLGIKLDSKGD